jgi:2-hydroxy-6-oxonona-2,4-dienedioate hydrolase
MANELSSPFSWKLIVLVVVGVVAVAFALSELPRYTRYMELARERQRSFGSQVIDTACGPIEYATAGEGAPVLVAHGAGGGYDQGIVTSQPLIGEGFRIIAPSRFGYQRTPVPSDGSPAAEADAYACLLDALGVGKAGVIGVSAGGLSAVQFALRHPDRLSGLVLLVPAAYSPEPPPVRSVSVAMMLAAVLKSDFVMWAATQLDPRAVLSDIGVPLPIQQQMTSKEKDEIMGWLFPFDMRVDGIMNEGKNGANLGPSPIEQITAPTLLFSARDDLWQTYGPAEYTAQHIPNAEFVGYDTGGHLLHGRDEEVWSKISAFFKQHSS